MTTRKQSLITVAAGLIVLGTVVAFREPILAQWNASSRDHALVFSGNIEAHEITPSFKTTQ